VSGDDLQYIAVELRRPRQSENLHGLIAEGQFCVEGDEVWLYSMDGQRIAKQTIIPLLNARETAARILRQRESVRRSNFNRRIVYDKYYY
jgi:hypothetical protein